MKEYKLKINGNDYAVTVANVEDTIAEVEVNGTPFKVEIERPAKKKISSAAKINKPAQVEANISRPVASGSETVVSSPLPGVILEVVVKEGDAVKKGQKMMEDGILIIYFFDEEETVGNFLIWPDGRIYVIDTESMKESERTVSYLSDKSYPEIYESLINK